MSNRPPTMSVPEAGKFYFDLEKRASYDAAARGDLVTVRVGRYLRVVTAAQDARLQALAEKAAAEAKAA